MTCHIGSVACYSAWRAPSSPHLACGLNGSFFLHPCDLVGTAQAGRLDGVVGRRKACGTLRGWVVFERTVAGLSEAILRGGSGKGLVFENGVGALLPAP